MSSDAEKQIEIPWTFTSNEEIDEAIEWLNSDAKYLVMAATNYQKMGDSWLAERVRINGQHSLAMAEALTNRRAALLSE